MMRIIRTILFAAGGYLAARFLDKRRSGSPPSRGWLTRRTGAGAVPDSATVSADISREGTGPRSAARSRRARGGKGGTGRSRAKTYLIAFARLLPIFAVGGFLVAASGIIPIKASSGHWAITEWFLQFSKSRSVATHSMGVRTPPLDDPALVLKGAGHFETGCLPCHGGPGREAPRIARKMTPLPPLLSTKVPERDPNELFYIVKHGIKFTGMPAWPALSRDDEVWAMVAFLLQLPDLNAEEYAALVFGEEVDVDPVVREDETLADQESSQDGAGLPDLDQSDTTLAASTPLQGLLYPEEIPAPVSDRCGRCHGADGAGRGLGAFPRLAGQRPAYLFAALRAYAEGQRHSGIMQPVAAGLGEEEMHEIALFYSRLTTPRATAHSAGASGEASDGEAMDVAGAASGGGTTRGVVDTLAIRRGERIAHEGIPRERVPSCAGCHGPSALPKNPFYPILAGQYADYIALQLDLFKDDRRGGSAYSRLMHPTADELTEEQVRDVALYYGSLNDGSLGSDLEQSGAAAADTTR